MGRIPKLVCLLTIFCLSLLAHFCVAEYDEQFIYNGFLKANLILGELATVNPKTGILQLTNTSQRITGHAFHGAPLTFKDSHFSFSTSFVFAMVTETSQPGGHGLAFTISPSANLSQAAPTDFLGLFNSSSNNQSTNHIFAIELDSVSGPSANDISNNHVGVDVNSIISIDSVNVSYYSSQERKNISLDLLSGNPMQVWIDYSEGEKKVNVTLAPMGISKPDQPLLSTSVDLSKILLEQMYVGFSASTGTIASDQYILGWSFNRSGPAQSLNISNLPKPPKPKVNSSHKDRNVIVGLSVVAVSLLVVIVVGAICIARRRRYREVYEDWEKVYGPQRLSYKKLYKATKGFREKDVLGEGGFGKVYRGTLPKTQKQVAVKKVSHDSERGMQQFVAEIAAMGRLRHRNLVELIGYCRRKGELILVYDYMPNGSLDKYLFTDESPNLSWPQRFQILRDVASALLYLHEEWEQEVLHRDVKASNVLLDKDFSGRLGDFGLARLGDHGADAQTTRVVGTVGYLAPELSRTGRATTATDVYSFGVFMLEVACGRRPLKADGPLDEILLVDWVFECWRRGALLDVCDPKLEGDFVVDEMELVLKLSLLCLISVVARRPSMRQVVQYLDGKSSSALPQLKPHDGVSLRTFFASDEAADPATSFVEMGSPPNTFFTP